MMRRLARAALAAITWGALTLAPAQADEPQVFWVLRADDYARITGCAGYGDKEPLIAAVRFLAFRDLPDVRDSIFGDIHYARRHGRPLFRALLEANRMADGALDPRCLTPGLRRMSLALRLLEPDGRYTDNEAEVDHVYDAAVARTDPPLPEAFPVMTRMAFIDRTGCLVSPSSYDKLREAFEKFVAWRGEEADAAAHMTAFMDDLVDSRPTREGYVEQRCMIPAVTRLAGAMDLLDDQGRYRSRR